MELRIRLWLLATLGMVLLLIFWHRRKAEKSEQVGSPDNFSNITLYFNPIHGEGHLFIGGMVVIITFSLFCYELAKALVQFSGL